MCCDFYLAICKIYDYFFFRKIGECHAYFDFPVTVKLYGKYGIYLDHKNGDSGFE